MTLLRRLAGETAIYGFSYILSRILHYVLFTWYLTRVYNDDTAQYGIYRDLYFYVAVLVVLLTFRMETTYFRFARDDRNAVTTMSMTFLFSLAGLFFLALLLFNNEIALSLDYPQLTEHIMLLGGVLFFDVMSAVPFASLRQQNRPVRFLLLKLGSIVLNIGFVLFFLELLPLLAESGDIWERVYRSADRLFFIILGNLIASAITFLALLPLLKGVSFHWDWSFLKRMLKFSWPLVIVAFAGVVNQYSAIFFQKEFLSADLTANLEEGAKYAAAASLALILSLFTTAYNYAAEPFFFAHRDKEGFREVYADAALAYTLVGSVMMLVILGYMDIFQLLLGQSFREGLEVVPILLVSFLFLGIYYNVSVWYKLSDRTLWGAWIAGLGTVITIVLSIILVQRWGVIGSAWTALACYVFMVFWAFYLGKKYYPIPYQIGKMMLWIVAAIAGYFVMEWLRPFFEERVPMVLLVNTMVIIFYCSVVYFLEKPLWRQLAGRS